MVWGWQGFQLWKAIQPLQQSSSNSPKWRAQVNSRSSNWRRTINTQKIAVAVIHGIGHQGPDFFEKIKAAIERHCGSDRAKDILFEPVYWAPVTRNAEDTLWHRNSAKDPLGFQTERRLLLDSLGTAIAYQPTAFDRQTYDAIHAVFANTLRRLSEQAGELAPLCIIAHSLGTVIASNFIYDLQKPQLISAAVRAEMGDTPLDKGETLTLLYTLGSPLAIWSLRFQDFGLPIKVPAPQLKQHYPNLAGGWFNYYDRNDIVAFPLKELNQAYAEAVTADVQRRAGGLLPSWNPLSHLEYWTASEVVDPIATALVNIWNTING